MLRLPRELRNIIYEFALSEPGGLYYWRDDGRPRFSGSRWADLDFNQLKYTSWQMYRESAGVELSLNTLVFGDFGEDGSSADFVEFLRDCSVGWQNSIREVSLRSSQEYASFWFELPPEIRTDFEYLHNIIEFCWTHPRSLVRWYRSGIGLNSSDPLFILNGLFHRYAIRNMDMPEADAGILVIPPKQLEVRDNISRHWRLDKDPDFLDCPNFRIMPEGVFDNTDYQTTSKWSSLFEELPSTPAMKQLWIALAQEWYERGI